MSDGASLGDDEGLLHLVEGDGIALYLKDGPIGDGTCLRIVGVKSATLLACRADHDPIVVAPESACVRIGRGDALDLLDGTLL